MTIETVAIGAAIVVGAFMALCVIFEFKRYFNE